MAPAATTIQDIMIITQNTPVSRKRRYSTMTRFLHITSDSILTIDKHHQKDGKRNALGVLSKAPIQGLSVTQRTLNPQALGTLPVPWSLMTANTTNWMGAKALFTALGRGNNPTRPTFVALQEHRNAQPEDCKKGRRLV